jgi:hypothetical protein
VVARAALAAFTGAIQADLRSRVNAELWATCA